MEFITFLNFKAIHMQFKFISRMIKYLCCTLIESTLISVVCICKLDLWMEPHSLSRQFLPPNVNLNLSTVTPFSTASFSYTPDGWCKEFRTFLGLFCLFDCTPTTEEDKNKDWALCSPKCGPGLFCPVKVTLFQ